MSTFLCNIHFNLLNNARVSLINRGIRLSRINWSNHKIWRRSNSYLVVSAGKMNRFEPILGMSDSTSPVGSPRDFSLNSLSLSLLSPTTAGHRPLTPSPLPSPLSSSPPPCDVASGCLQATIDALTSAVSKKGTKASLLSVDEDMINMCYNYSNLNTDERSDFLMHISTKLSTNHKLVTDVIDQRPCKESDAEGGDIEASLMRWEDRLRQALQPPHHWIASQISRLPGGVKFLVDLRQDLLTTLSCKPPDVSGTAALKAFDGTLRDLLSLWFTVGLLKLTRVTWNSSCDMLQKISEYEAVHPVRSWTDLKQRVGSYRRCFVFTHACMPNEPLVVLHTFLTNEISKSMIGIVQNPRYLSFDESSMKSGEDPSEITTAIFYSITSTQKGLQGIELGHYMIKSVVNELKAEFPRMSQFSSLSPIPGYAKWLLFLLVRAQRGEVNIFTDEELIRLQQLLQMQSQNEVYDELRRILSSNSWLEEENLVQTLEVPLMRLCAAYLYSEKRRGYALDGVANFHLKNGAAMWRINWLADLSARGLTNSCGIMVNYRYFLEDCEVNSCQYLETAKIVASESVVELAKQSEQLFKETVKKPHLNPPIINVVPD